ncbi:MAG: hypothetical protein C4538_10115 [Nitrospiraceae bacterium]|nr:MAG: hypothetical protein C4538_10115 [Nitrospiraceae bacterium]
MKRKNIIFFVFLVVLAVLVNGCATHQYSYRLPTYETAIEKDTVLRNISIPAHIEEKILALKPESVSEKDVNEVLSHAHAPRIMNVHGGIYPVYLAMESFSKFLIFMGYPEENIRNPVDGTYSYSCYESSRKLAGMLAWYYEREGMRPMMIGHSQGGIQTVKVLHQLAGSFDEEIPLWNPFKDMGEERFSIIDPLTGNQHPVVGLKLSYASAVGAGGITRFLPNQWNMNTRLRSIPDSVMEFTGFYMGMDIFGGDLLGFGDINKYEPNGTAIIRNVRLPASYSHVIVPVTRHLAKHQDTRDWINAYVPSEEPELDVELKSSTSNILWAADVWHSIKKHWVIELQNLIRAKKRLMQ